MRVALAEDDYIYRAGLVRCLAAADIEVTCAAAAADEVLAHLADRDPAANPRTPSAAGATTSVDVVILDIRLSRTEPDDGLRAAETITQLYPDVGVLLLSAYAEYHYAYRLFEHRTGGRGYALKENFTNVATITHALDRVAGGHSYMDPEILELLMPQARRPRLEHLLTAREHDLLALIAAGRTNAAIALQLKISSKSVEATATSIFRKLGIRSDSDHNPRVLAALRWHEEHGNRRTGP